MKLRETIPDSVLSAAREAGLNGEQILLSTHTGIDLLGNDIPQWLLLTQKKLLVITQNNGVSQAVHNIPARRIRDARIAPQVGSGLLQVKAEEDEHFVDILRFENNDATKFSRVAHKLSQMAEGKPVVVLPEDEKDERVCQSCGRPVGEGQTLCPRCVNKGRTILRMMGLMTRYWPYGLSLMVLLLISIGLTMVPYRLQRTLVDDVLGVGKEEPGVPGQSMRLLGLVALLYLGVYVLRYILSVTMGMLSTFCGTVITDDMRQRMYRRLQELSIRYYDSQPIGALISRVTGDTQMLYGFVDQVTSGMIANIIMIFVVGGRLFYLQPDLAVWVLAPAPLVVFLSRYYYRRVRPMWTHMYEARARMGGNLQSALSGFRVVKAFGQEDRETQRFGGSSGQVRREHRRVGVASSLFGPLIALLFQLGTVLVLYLGGRRALHGEMTPGELMEYVGLLMLFYAPLGSLSMLSRWVTQFAAASHRIFEVLDQVPEVPDPPAEPVRQQVEGEIEFDHVEFGYDRRQPVLHNLGFQIKPGETIGVVGRSGAGKTTMVNLVCRFYDPTGGTVKVDGIDLRQWDPTALRQQIGLVLQEPLLFRGSIFNNLTYGRSGASMTEVIKAARAANAHNFIMAMPEAYDTHLGEGGSGLSGGQRQRVSIARALLTDPRVLILDEATSSVDTESEREIQNAIAALSHGRTVIAIAHRLSTLRNSDRILVMDRGALKEVGTHYELMAQNGIYARLVRLQTQLTKDDSVDGLQDDNDYLELQRKAQEERQSRSVPEFKGVRFLEPGELEFSYDEHGFPLVRVEELDGQFHRMRAYRARPATMPYEFISIGYQTEDGGIREIGMVPDIRRLSRQDRQCMDKALGVRYFLYNIRRITSLKEDLGILLWDVETDRGPKQFSIGRDHSRVGQWGMHGRVVRDMNDNRYVIPDMRQLDLIGRNAFNRHVYWCPYKEKEAEDLATVEAGANQ